MRTRRSWRNQDRLWRELGGAAKQPHRKRRTPKRRAKPAQLPSSQDGTRYAVGVLEIDECDGIRALRLCLAEIEQFHSRAYPDCAGGCPAHEAMAAAKKVLGEAIP